MRRYMGSKSEKAPIALQQKHEISDPPEQPNEPDKRNASVVYERVEEADTQWKYEENDKLIPLKTWKHHWHWFWAALGFAYRTNGFRYEDDSIHRHRDFASRVQTRPYRDAHFDLNSGELCRLIVQCTDDVYEDAKSQATWCRTYVRKPSPYFVRAAIWTLDSIHNSKSCMGWCFQAMRTLPASLLMSSVSLGGLFPWTINYCNYPQILHTYWGDAKVWSNLLENSRDLPPHARNSTIYRQLKPHRLCLLTSDSRHGWIPINVAEWESKPENMGQALSYLLVAYTAEHFDHDSNEDMEYLHRAGMLAARKAGIPAFWVSASCLGEDQDDTEIYRISDVLRGAKKMIIVVGSSKYESPDTLDHDPLEQWGTRMWTFPEVLLSPGEEILVFTRGGDLSKPEIIPKNQVASRIWPHDANISRQLVDHYLGTIHLSRIELAVLALKCLFERQTTTFSPGDHAYALMGLLRIRPLIDKSDSQFQAFARLSLSNDSDKLLERYICTLPLRQDQPWYDMTDAYDSSLWDIDPACQVAAICDNDTIVLDGARGAVIEWSKFHNIWYSTGDSWKRWIASALIRGSWVLLILVSVFSALKKSAALAQSGSPAEKRADESDGGSHGTLYHVYFGLQMTFLAIWLATVLFYPLLVRTVLAGKVQDIQGAFFGVEGCLNPSTVDRLIFGGNFDRFKWSTNGSLLSRLRINEHMERVGIHPCVDGTTRDKVHTAKGARPGDTRVFTLIDTYNLEVTLFEAVRPPNVLLFCGSEGGKQRAVGCSYDWTTQTFYRETVLRVPTESLERVSRVPRFRMGIKRPDSKTVSTPSKVRAIPWWKEEGSEDTD